MVNKIYCGFFSFFIIIISNRFPFYYWIKIAIIFYIVTPTGSTFLYKRFIQPLLKEREQVGFEKKKESNVLHRNFSRILMN